MNKRIKVIIYIAIFIIEVVALIIFLNTKNVQEQNNQIIQVGEENFEKEVLDSKKKVLIDFYATWCNPCTTLQPTIEEIASEYKNLKVVKINVDECKELVSKYNIKALPTLIIINKGNEINRSTGIISKDKILEMCEIK